MVGTSGVEKLAMLDKRSLRFFPRRGSSSSIELRSLWNKQVDENMGLHQITQWRVPICGGRLPTDKSSGVDAYTQPAIWLNPFLQLPAVERASRTLGNLHSAWVPMVSQQKIYFHPLLVKIKLAVKKNSSNLWWKYFTPQNFNKATKLLRLSKCQCVLC